jgi:hypothetical protein
MQWISYLARHVEQFLKKKKFVGVLFSYTFLYANQTQVFERLMSVALFISEFSLF